MTTRERLQELYEKGKQSGFRLPPGITTKKTYSADGYQIQIFNHESLGEIGRMIIIPEGKETKICYEVAGDPDDPMTEERKNIFGPIANQISDIMNNALGGSITPVTPYSLDNGGDIIESKVYPCDICHEITSMMICAHDAEIQGDLENYARKMYPKVKELNVPTWVVGKEKEITLTNGIKTGEAILMKIWPIREKAKIIDAEQFNKEIDQLMEEHCKT